MKAKESERINLSILIPWVIIVLFVSGFWIGVVKIATKIL